MSKKVIGGVLAAGVAIAASAVYAYFDYNSAVYECHDCGIVHKPAIGSYLMGMHVPGKRLLKCPHCGSYNWHYRTLNKD